jgi:Short C-terminal domain/Phospholipase_D-nuclease N-terminal
MVIAADYPFLDILWSMLIFFAFVAWIWILITLFSDIFRRRDIGGWAKAGWTVFLIVLPFLGALVYLINHDGMVERNVKDTQAIQAEVDDRIRSVAGSGGGAAAEIARAKSLLDSGAITESEFQELKTRALASGSATAG